MAKRWELNEDQRAIIVERLMGIVSDGSSSNDDVMKAARVLITAENQNRVDEQNGSIDEQRSRIVEIVERIRSRAIGVDSTNQEIERIDEK
jgi:hypothetical protein